MEDLWSTRKAMLEQQAEDRAKQCCLKWQKDKLSLQQVIDESLQDYIELYEKASALRMQFEHEKSAWKSTMLQMARDEAQQAYQQQLTVFGPPQELTSITPCYSNDSCTTNHANYGSPLISQHLKDNNSYRHKNATKNTAVVYPEWKSDYNVNTDIIQERNNSTKSSMNEHRRTPADEVSTAFSYTVDEEELAAHTSIHTVDTADLATNGVGSNGTTHTPVYAIKVASKPFTVPVQRHKALTKVTTHKPLTSIAGKRKLMTCDEEDANDLPNCS